MVVSHAVILKILLCASCNFVASTYMENVACTSKQCINILLLVIRVL